MPQTAATAPPPVLPPQVFERSCGFRVAPNTVLKVCDPRPNSGTLVFPITIPPAFFSRSTNRQSAFGISSLCSGDPNVVRIPLVACRSLTPIGNPCKGPNQFPLASASSAACASASSCSSSTRVTIALTLGFTRAICCRCAFMTSTEETFLVRSNPTSSVASMKQISSCAVCADSGWLTMSLPFSLCAFPNNGSKIAVTAAVDPAFNTSRRVRFLIISPFAPTTFYHKAMDCADLPISYVPRATNDCATFEDMEIFPESSRLIGALRRPGARLNVSIYGQPWFAFFLCYPLRVCLAKRSTIRPGFRSGSEQQIDALFSSKSRRGPPLYARRSECQLEPARTNCPWERVGGRTAVSSISPENGAPGSANCFFLRSHARNRVRPR